MLTGFRLGVTPFSEDAPSPRSPAAFAEALSDLVGRRVELHQASDYRVLLAAVDQGIVQFAWLPPIAAARGVQSGSIVPAAVAVRNGSTSYLAGLISLARSPVKTLADLKGVRAAWVDRESASGYVVIRAALREAGVRLVDAFGEELFVRSHAEVARALREGRADVGATCFNYHSGTFDLARTGYLERAFVGPDEIRVLAHAGPIPADVFAVHKSVVPQYFSTVQAALSDARNIRVHDLAMELMQCDGFVKPTPEHHAMLKDLLAMVEARGSVVPPKRSSIPPSKG